MCAPVRWRSSCTRPHDNGGAGFGHIDVWGRYCSAAETKLGAPYQTAWGVYEARGYVWNPPGHLEVGGVVVLVVRGTEVKP